VFLTKSYTIFVSCTLSNRCVCVCVKERGAGVVIQSVCVSQWSVSWSAGFQQQYVVYCGRALGISNKMLRVEKAKTTRYPAIEVRMPIQIILSSFFLVEPAFAPVPHQEAHENIADSVIGFNGISLICSSSCLSLFVFKCVCFRSHAVSQCLLFRLKLLFWSS